VLIAQITDTHIRPKGKLLHHMPHTARSLRRCVARLEALDPKPDVVVATGDLVDRGKAKEYRRFRKIIGALSMPVFLIPGNHDVRDALRDAFPEHRYLPARGHLSYAVDTLPVRLIGLDSTRVRHSGGELDDARLDWFEAALAAAPQRPTFVFMHHPPFAVGIAPIDAHGFGNRARFAAIVAANRQIVRIACGHIHHAASARIGDVLALSAPSTAPQVVFARTPGGNLRLRLEQPSFVLHRWDGRQMHTRVEPVEPLEAGELPSVRRVS
jgi:3',5'-cyclic AMP phosphodiesterase CpdA